jgi:hypothetical protein
MSDPRNVAHNKKVKQEKAHHENAPTAGAKPKKKKASKAEDADPQAVAPETAPVEQAPADYEKSQTVLSRLKDMEFHSREYRGAGRIDPDD